MWRRVAGMAGRHLGFAILISVFVSSLLLNVVLGLKIPAKRVIPKGITAGIVLKSIPILSGTGFGSSLTFGSGQPVMLYIMKPGCPWCARNLENIRLLAKKLGSTHKFVGVSYTDEGLADELEGAPLPFRIYLLDMRNLPREFGDPRITPQMALIDPSGRVQSVWLGALQGKTRADVEQRFDITLPGFPVKKL